MALWRKCQVWFWMWGCLNTPLLLYPNLICSFSTIKQCSVKIYIFFPVFTSVRKRFTKLHHHRLAACIIGWLIRMSLFCQCSYLLNFQFVFLANRARQPGWLPYYSSVSVCRSPSLHSTLDNILRLRKNWPRRKFLLEIPTVPAAYGHMPTLHLSHHPSFHPVLNQALYPSYLHPLVLEEGSKHDCNYNQTRWPAAY